MIVTVRMRLLYLIFLQVLALISAARTQRLVQGRRAPRDASRGHRSPPHQPETGPVGAGTPRPAVADEPASRSPHPCGGPGTRHSSGPTRRTLTQALLHQIIGPLTRQFPDGGPGRPPAPCPAEWAGTDRRRTGRRSELERTDTCPIECGTSMPQSLPGGRCASGSSSAGTTRTQ
jgi:hypothetical protein